MSLYAILLILLVVILIGAMPTWGYSSGWGYGPSGITLVLIAILLVLAIRGGHF